MPEEAQTKDSVEPAKILESFTSIWTIDQKVSRLSSERQEAVVRLTSSPRLEIWKVAEELQTFISDILASFEATQVWLGGERRNSTIAYIGSKQIDFLELLTEPEI